MRRIIFLAVSALLITSFVVWYLSTPSYLPVQSINKQIKLDSNKLWSLVNEHRIKLGLKPFIKDQRLCEIANIRSIDIQKDYSHDQFIPRLPKDSLNQIYSENIVSAINEDLALKGWLVSTPHRKAIDGNWTYSCIATNGSFAVQIFSSFDNTNHNAVN